MLIYFFIIFSIPKMAVTINPGDFNSYAELNVLDRHKIICLTNNPQNITFGKLMNALNKSTIKIIDTNGKLIDMNKIYLRHSKSKNNYDNNDDMVPFENNASNIDVVIQTDDNIYIPEISKENELLTKEYSLGIDNNYFSIFIRDLYSVSVMVTDDTKIGYIANVIEKKYGYPVGVYRMLAKGKVLELDNTIGYYGLKKDMTIHIVMSLKGGMFHVTSGRDGGYNNSNISFIDMD